MPDWVSDILQAGDFDHARNMIKENEVRDMISLSTRSISHSWFAKMPRSS